ncbi:adenine phosphoribosyltransferase [Schistosoma bovis]|nr:adenine phosphoribosyltransferase [Schistosoma bovis]
MQKNVINSGDNVLLLDDVLATGGSLEACVNLVNLSGAKVLFSLLYMELKNLPGRKKLENLGVPVYSLFQV